MSHLRPEDKTPRLRRLSCRKGRHEFGEAQQIGGGITRQVCETCSAVSIDLSGAHGRKTPIVSKNEGTVSLETGETDEP